MNDSMSAGAGALLDEIFRGAPGLREPEAVGPDDAALVAYLSGVLPADEAARVERGLVRHPVARRRLHAVADRLDSLQALPWTLLETPDDGVGRAWHTLTSSRLTASPAARGRWVAAGWEAIRSQAAAGVADAQAAWTVFLSFADQWDRARRLPRLAEARGGAAALQTDSLPSGVTVVLEADVTPDGDLAVRAWVQESSKPSTAMDGQTATLALSTGLDSWPLADAVVRDSEAIWNLKGAGWELGLSPGPLPTGDLKVLFNPSSVLLPADTTRVLMAQDDSGVNHSVYLHGQPRREVGRLRLTLALDRSTLITHANDQLAVSTLIAPGLRQRLGAWPVGDWSDNVRSVDIPCPGPDGDFDSAALSFDLIA